MHEVSTRQKKKKKNSGKPLGNRMVRSDSFLLIQNCKGNDFPLMSYHILGELFALYFLLAFSCQHLSVQFSSVAQSCPTLCNPMNHSTPDLPVHHQLLEFTQTHVHRVSDAIQPSHPLSSSSPPAPSPSQHQSFPMSQLFA